MSMKHSALRNADRDESPNSYRADREHAKTVTEAPSKLRICHLGKYYHPFRGGIETHVQSIAHAQAAANNDVTVACINHLDSKGQDVWWKRLATTPSSVARDGEVNVKRFGKFGTLARFDFCLGLRSFLREAPKNFDLLHLHVPNPVMCVAIATTRVKIPIVITYHSDIVKQKFIRKPFSLIENSVFSSVNRIIVTSQAYRDGSPVLARYGDKCEVIPYGLDLRPFKTVRPGVKDFADELRRKANGEPIWLCVGRMVYYKGTEVAIRALVDCPGRLVLIGNGELWDSHHELAKSLNVADRIDWYPMHTDDQLLGAYQAATAMMFPSVFRSEAFGIVQIEAMASGCPVINTHIPDSGVSWVSLDEVSGLTIPMNDPKALAAAANRLVDDPGFRNRLAVGAVARAEQYFSIEEMTERTQNIYARVLGRSAELVPEPSCRAMSSSLNSKMESDTGELSSAATGCFAEP